MRNITVSVDDETYRRARITAAEQGRSVSAMVRDYLASLGAAAGDEGARREAWQRLWEGVDACQVRVGTRPTRARTYDDPRLH
jgi:plasmid stability protein